MTALLISCGLIAYALALRIGRTDDERVQGRLVAGAVVLLLAVLATFKYLGAGLAAAGIWRRGECCAAVSGFLPE